MKDLEVCFCSKFISRPEPTTRESNLSSLMLVILSYIVLINILSNSFVKLINDCFLMTTPQRAHYFLSFFPLTALPVQVRWV